MDPARIITHRTLELSRPGRAGDVGTGTFPGGGLATSPHALSYVVYSGATGTVHRRLALGISGQGLGGEFV